MAKLTSKQRKILESVIRAPFTKEEEDQLKRINVDNYEFPHWSTKIKDWPSTRWDAIMSAPKSGRVIRIRFLESEFYGSNTHRDSHHGKVSKIPRTVEGFYDGDNWVTKVDQTTIKIPTSETYMEWQPLDTPRSHDDKLVKLKELLQVLDPKMVTELICSVQPMNNIPDFKFPFRIED